MRVGFTGTQKGMTEAQIKEVTKLMLSFHDVTSVHHGGCIGADEQFHEICLKTGIDLFYIHPASDVDESKHAKFERHDLLPVIVYSQPKPALIRNHDIVNEVEGPIIACPSQDHEILRSGTWATIRYTNKMGWSNLWIIYPDGKIQQFWRKK